MSQASLEILAREEMGAYRTVMEKDPLLPSVMLPRIYKGKEAHSLHRKLVKEIARRL
jgi:DNA-binding transcriptional regulator PaaX